MAKAGRFPEERSRAVAASETRLMRMPFLDDSHISRDYRYPSEGSPKRATLIQATMRNAGSAMANRAADLIYKSIDSDSSRERGTTTRTFQ